MAALDFPASPTNGQVYNNWIYSSSKGAWQAKPLTGAKMAVSATAPSNPTLGDEWYNSNDGNAYVYYTDVDGSQWVQVKSDATLSSTLGNRVTTLETYPSGLVPVVPTSVTVGSGSGSASSLGIVTFSGATSVSLNGVFTSSYRNYTIEINVLPSSGSYGYSLYSRLRTSGVDNTGSVYYLGGYEENGSTLSVYNSSATSMNIATLGTDNSSSITFVAMQVREPQVSGRTGIFSQSGSYVSGNNYSTTKNGLTTAADQFDGITFFSGGAGNISGTVQIHGLR